MELANKGGVAIRPDRDLLLWRHDFYLPAFEYMFRQMGDLRGKRILELGAGTGGTAVMLAKHGATVTGIDLLPFRLVEAEERAIKHGVIGSVEFVLMDAMQLAFWDNAFDFVISKSVLIFTDHERTAEECYRVLKPGGKAIFIENMRSHPVIWLYRKFFLEYSANVHYFSMADVAKLGGHFDCLQHREFHLLSVGALFWKHLLPVAPIYRLKLKSLRAIDGGLLKLCPLLNRLCWITAMICGKT